VLEPRCFDADGQKVVVKLMDNSWILNQCVGAHPIVPQEGVVWSRSEHCARLPIPGDEFPGFIRETRDAYGNCAVIAWHGERVLGHLVFLPRVVARRWKAAGSERFGPATEDDGTLVIINLAFCSLSGHEFRGRGIGKALVAMTVDWARQNNWRRVEVYGASGGLFPCDWYDACIPPRPFWEGRRFLVFSKCGEAAFPERALEGIVADNPRADPVEQQQKKMLLAALQRREIDAEFYARSYDLRRTL
jgi:GNAT superfamily N-acetyltransferase